ncbi:hypothetical protein HMI54_006029 [Coelomomyces lativittatus]|nr:hypothetical protein HMI55_007153 [Coelomomyces lativittatus]KAJ1511842.1 hypothetical protein HMI56_004874 [Coelomomyces lativittatus]KAJ1517325.1 hypothetical protein HMI54_006029 [Coelomomyces lativittatus]
MNYLLVLFAVVFITHAQLSSQLPQCGCGCPAGYHEVTYDGEFYCKSDTPPTPTPTAPTKTNHLEGLQGTYRPTPPGCTHQ